MSGERAPFEFTADLTICIDFRNPHAYLALAPTRALERRLGCAFDWLPFAAPALHRAPPVRADDDRGTRHRRIRALYFERDLERYAFARGSVLGELHRSGDPSCAAAGLMWLRERRDATLSDYVQRVFERFWRDDHGFPDACATATLLGVPLATFETYLEAWGRGALDTLQAALAAAGVFNVPTYVLRDGETFMGRQHLPLLEARLRAR